MPVGNFVWVQTGLSLPVFSRAVTNNIRVINESAYIIFLCSHGWIHLTQWYSIGRAFTHRKNVHSWLLHHKKRIFLVAIQWKKDRGIPRFFFPFCFVYFGALPTRGGLVPAVRDQRAPGVVKWSSLLLSDYEIPPGRERQTCSLLYYPPYFPDAFLRPSKCFSLSCSLIWSTCKLLPVSCLN